MFNIFDAVALGIVVLKKWPEVIALNYNFLFVILSKRKQMVF